MKSLLLSLTLTLTVSAFSQSVITRKIFAFETLERNSKTIQISKQTQDEGFSYILIAENETSKDYVRFSFAASQDNISQALDNIKKMLIK